PEPVRLIVRRAHLSRRHAKKLTALEKLTGRRDANCATNNKRMHRQPGSHQAHFLDTLHRHHAEIEDRGRTNKAKRHSLHDEDELAGAEPESMRFRPYHQSARLARHARRRFLRLERTWPWAEAFTICWQRLTALPTPT